MEIARQSIRYRPIGVIHSPHVEPAKTPIQPRYADGYEGTVEVFPEYAAGLADVESFSHIVLLYHLHRAGRPRLRVVPFHDVVPRGVFSTRAPSRPNAIGLSVLPLLHREGRMLRVGNLDILDGTPLLDIKPHIERFGVEGIVRSGWQQGIEEETARRRERREG